uniref:Protein Abitram n=1 Tax=Parastrongyloides trichosuri TaxID=131310 RepID=A0A0N4ZFR3_PARTI
MSELYYESITDKNFQYHEIEEYKDLCYLRHPSGVIVVSLNKDHVGMGEEIVKVEWDVNKKGADKVKSNIVGRGKKGGRTLYPNTTLCILMTKSGKEYPIKFGMKASCIEMNDRLEANPDLVRKYPINHGYLAIVMPNNEDRRDVPKIFRSD